MGIGAQHAATSEYKYGERVIPGRAPVYLFAKHASRYQFIAEAAMNKTLLDVGCGEGYGTYYLAQSARQAIGVDIASEIIARSQKRYQSPQLSYQVMDATDLSFRSCCFDIVCSFEVFEHISAVETFLEECRRVLRPGGAFYVSTPNKYSYVAAGHNPWHVKEYSLQEFDELLRHYFPSVEIYGQFCQRPLRERLYRLSSAFFFNSRIYRLLVYAIAPLYLLAFWGRRARDRTNWFETIDTSLFAFSRVDPQNADSFLAVCRKGT